MRLCQPGTGRRGSSSSATSGSKRPRTMAVPRGEPPIVRVEHGQIVGPLPLEQNLLGRRIFVHAGVPVEMVRREARDHADMRHACFRPKIRKAENCSVRAPRRRRAGSHRDDPAGCRRCFRPARSAGRRPGGWRRSWPRSSTCRWSPSRRSRPPDRPPGTGRSRSSAGRHFRRAIASQGFRGRTAGLTTTRSAWRKSSSRCPPRWKAAIWHVGETLQRGGQGLFIRQIGHGDDRTVPREPAGRGRPAAKMAQAHDGCSLSAILHDVHPSPNYNR